MDLMIFLADIWLTFFFISVLLFILGLVGFAMWAALSGIWGLAYAVAVHLAQRVRLFYDMYIK